LFGRQRRRQQQWETQRLRDEVDALAAQPPSNAAISHLETTISSFLQHSESAQAARDATVVHLWHKVIDQEHDVTAAVRQLVTLCASLTEHIEIQRREQQELLDVVRALGQKLELPSKAGTPKLIGGSVFATDQTSNGADVIDITEPSPTPPRAPGESPLGFGENQEPDHDETRRDDGWHAAR
jgi:hypothetical protein